MAVKPISPQEAALASITHVPDFVVSAWNECIAKQARRSMSGKVLSRVHLSELRSTIMRHATVAKATVTAELADLGYLDLEWWFVEEGGWDSVTFQADDKFIEFVGQL